MKLAINGMGRIGRLLFRRLLQDERFEVVAVNDIMDSDNLVYLIKYDSVYGPMHTPVERDAAGLTIFGKRVRLLRESDPSLLPWRELGVDLVLECSGRFTNREGAGNHLKAGARNVILSTTGAPELPLMIYGHESAAAARDTDILSPGGCMTNCCTHLIDLMKPFGIASVQINVVHSYTSRQELVDGPHPDFRRGRAAAEAIIPVPVDLGQSLERLFPELAGKIATLTTRVPVNNGAFADLTFALQEPVTAAEVNARIAGAAATSHKGILKFTEEPLVSIDVRSDPHSAIVDGSLTSVVGQQVKLLAFFDNEYGYTSRVIDWVKVLSEGQGGANL